MYRDGKLNMPDAIKECVDSWMLLPSYNHRVHASMVRARLCDIERDLGNSDARAGVLMLPRLPVFVSDMSETSLSGVTDGGSHDGP